MKLKPCPFCGTQPTTEDIAGITMVVCNDLDCSLSDRFSVSEWNSRPCEDKQKRKAKKIVRRAERVITELRIDLERARQAWETWTYMPTKPCAHLRIRYDSSGTRCTDCGMVFSGHITCDAASTGDA